MEKFLIGAMRQIWTLQIIRMLFTIYTLENKIVIT